MEKKLLLVGITILLSISSFGQFNGAAPWMQQLKKTSTANNSAKGSSTKAVTNANFTFKQIQESFNHYYQDKDIQQKGIGFKPFKRWENNWKPFVKPDGYLPSNKEMASLWQEKQVLNLDENPNANWSTLGPTSLTNEYYTGMGRINTIAIDPDDPNIWYVGAPAGGFWKSTDAGNTWRTTTDHFFQLGVSGIAIDPTNTAIIYITTGDDDAGDSVGQGVFKSMDGGETWNETGLNLSSSPTGLPQYGFGNMNEIIIDPNNVNTLWAGSSTGLYKTTDAGSNWSNKLELSIVDIKVKPGDYSTLYVTAFGYADPVNYTGYGCRLYKSVDGGESFTLVENGAPINSSRMMIGVTPANPNLVYAISVQYNSSNLTSFDGLYKSIDSGNSFTKTSYDGTNANWFQAWYDLTIAVSPTDENLIMLGLISLHRSVDGGETFQRALDYNIPNNRFHVDVHYMNYYDGKLFLGSDGGVFVSEDNGAFFNDKSFGLGITMYYKISVDKNNPNRIIGGTQDNGGLAYDNGNWISWHGGDGMDNIINPNNPNEIWGMTQLGGFLSKSSDFGQSVDFWAYPPTKPNGQSYSGLWEAPVEMAVDGTLFVAYENTLFTMDESIGWQLLNDDFDITWIEEVRTDPKNPEVLYVTGMNKLWKSSDKGQSFSLLASFNDFITDVQLNENNPNEIYISLQYSYGIKDGVNKSIVFKSSDGGLTFKDISYNLPLTNSWFVNRLAHQGNHSDSPLFLCDRLGKVFRLNQTTKTWEDYSNGLPQVFVRDMVINPKDGLLTVGTYGRGIWRSTIPIDNNFQNELRIVSNDLKNAKVFVEDIGTDFTLHNDSEIMFPAATAQLLVNGQLWSEQEISLIAAGASLAISFPNISLAKGKHEVLLNILPLSTNEWSNQFESFTVFSNDFAAAERFFDFENEEDTWLAFDMDNLNESQWQRGIPSGSKLNSALEGSQSYATILNGPYADSKRSILVSPSYDFESIDNPIMEFSLMFDLENFEDAYNGGYQYYDIFYVEYSKDKGDSWQLLDKPSQDGTWYTNQFGSDYYTSDYNYFCRTCIGGQWVGSQLQPVSFTYNFNQVAQNGGIDLTNEKNVMFRFVISPDDDTLYQSSNTFEGVVLDAFAIRGAQNDDDDDNDGILNVDDNCPNNPNPDQGDADNDGIGDVCDEDADNDGILDEEDNCPFTANPQQEDQDQDGVGDVCDTDLDNDGILDVDDNCVTVVNPDQADADNDGAGDLCDEDDDNDGILDVDDLCPFLASENNNDNDGDGIGDICDEDDDNDGFLDSEDLCPFTASESNTDNDGDGIGDVCDDNDDNDNYLDEVDLCPFTADDNNADNDGDGIGDICDDDDDNDGFLDTADLCPFLASTTNTDNDGDGIGDVCDDNDDNDNYLDEVDLCPFTADDNNADNDGDGIGDVCDDDDDNDGYLDPVDRCPFTASNNNEDNDLDGLGDVCDPDDDNDGILDEVDNCPLVSNADQSDIDGDGLGDACDDDSDNDGVIDIFDQCPDTPANSTVNVNGCPVFTLPTNNFALTTSSATCVDSNNGKIRIVANELYSYTASLRNEEGVEQVSEFTETMAFEDLPPGTYDVCITIAEEPTYEQCFSIEITAPDALSVSSKIGFSEEFITLQMYGGSSYYIELNGETIETSEPSITLNLNQQENTLRVKTNLDCQGVYEESIIVGNQLAIYPNPLTGNELQILLGKDHESKSSIVIYTLNGSLVFEHEQAHTERQFTVQLNDLAAGMYLMRLQNGQKSYQKKIIKK
ncbi:MAG: thrombospondin type 3 repeat-containing protein [Croceitalea sp.]|nr:thrombospondin type 3 repeat-containing protein [Croceitalea sp.]